MVGVLDLQSFLLRLVPELGEPLEEQRVRARGQGAFPTQPDRLGGGHPSGSVGKSRNRFSLCKIKSTPNKVFQTSYGSSAGSKTCVQTVRSDRNVKRSCVDVL